MSNLESPLILNKPEPQIRKFARSFEHIGERADYATERAQRLKEISWRRRKVIMLIFGFLIATVCTYLVMIYIPIKTKLAAGGIATLITVFWAIEASITGWYIIYKQNKSTHHEIERDAWKRRYLEREPEQEQYEPPAQVHVPRHKPKVEEPKVEEPVIEEVEDEPIIEEVEDEPTESAINEYV